MPTAHRTALPRPRRRVRRPAALLAAAAAVLAVLAVLAGPAPAARADDSGAALGFGGGASFGVLDSGNTWSLVDSGYSLADVDPMTGNVGAGDISTTLTSAYVTANDAISSDLFALDTGAMAEQARAEAEARRQAALNANSGKLRAGSVPDPYGPMVEDAVAKYCPQLPVGVFAAQLAQESGWNPRAQSPVGAQGIAQFMPGTWASSGVDGDGDGRKDVFNPADAIPAAAAYDCSLLAAVHDVPGDAVSNMLAAYNAGAGAVRSAGGVPPYAETQNYVRTILARAADYTDSSDATGSVGCPTSVPSGTLRQGADAVGISTLCARSAAQARSPQAAAAVKWALSHLGLPYSQPQRNSAGYADCSSFVSRAYQAAGVNIAPPGRNAPTTQTIRSSSWAVPEPLSQARPGDLVEPTPGHVAMVLADGWLVHTNTTGDVSHVRRLYTSAYMTFRVDPARV